jgi:wyosine [tRNA(Phe)-imidazoG37] synthetase (radical SAM superfamily)
LFIITIYDDVVKISAHSLEDQPQAFTCQYRCVYTRMRSLRTVEGDQRNVKNTSTWQMGQPAPER